MIVYKIYTIIQGCYNNIYKVNKLTVQGKYTNCIRSVQDCHLWRILVDFKQFFFSCHPRTAYSPTTNSFISCTLFNSYIIIQILIPIMMFGEKFCFYILHYFLNQIVENMVHKSYVDT